MQSTAVAMIDAPSHTISMAAIQIVNYTRQPSGFGLLESKDVQRYVGCDMVELRLHSHADLFPSLAWGSAQCLGMRIERTLCQIAQGTSSTPPIFPE